MINTEYLITDSDKYNNLWLVVINYYPENFGLK